MKTRHKNPTDIDLLLSRGRLSGPAKERVLREVLEATASALPLWHRLTRWTRRPAAIWTWSLATAAAAMVAFGVHMATPPSAPEDAWQARGGIATNEPQLEATCAGPCHPGSLLVLRLQKVAEPAWVAAYAMTPQGQRIWYFPTDGGQMPHVSPQQQGVLPQGIKLGAEHPVGAYTLHVVLSRTHITREEILELDHTPHSADVIAQIARKFEIIE